MAEIIGGVKVAGFISPTDSNDTYPVTDSIYGIDGLRNYSGDTSVLNTIPTSRRRAGMIVGVENGSKYYKLKSAPWNDTLSDWEEFNVAGGANGQVQYNNNGITSGATSFEYDTITGNVGLGTGATATPAKLTVVGDVRLNGIVSGEHTVTLPSGLTWMNQKFYVKHTTGSGLLNRVQIELEEDGVVTSRLIGEEVFVINSKSTNQPAATLQGQTAFVQQHGSGNLSSMVGGRFLVGGDGTGIVDYASYIAGLSGPVDYPFHINNFVGLEYGQFPGLGGGGVDNAWGIVVGNVNGSNTARGIETQVNLFSAGTKHNLYIAGTAPSFFNASVGIGVTNPDPSSILDITSTNKGLLIPRISTVQRNTIGSPANGLQVYNTDTNKVNTYNNLTAQWEEVGTKPNSMTNAARLAISGGSLTDGLTIYDTNWQCDFRYNSSGAYWQQLNRPRHTLTVANTLSNPVNGYRVWLTDLNTEAVYNNTWTYTIEVRKPSNTSRANDATATADPDLQINIGAGVWEFEIQLYSTFPLSAVGARFSVDGPITVTPINNFVGTAMLGNGISTLTVASGLLGTLEVVNTFLSTSGSIWAKGTWVTLSSGTFRVKWGQGTSSANALTINQYSYLKMTKKG
jgi:hypothetical protein